MSNKALLIVRAEVASPSDRPLFDDWYRTELCPRPLLPSRRSVHGGLGADWSLLFDYAFYEFSDIGAALTAIHSDAINFLIAKFDDAWGDRVNRTRDVVETIDSLPHSS